VLPEIRYRKWETPSTPIGPAFPPPSGDDFGPPGTVVFSLGPTAAPPDPRLSDHAWNLRQIDVPTGTSGGAGIRVGVVDTGSLDHPELEGAWVDSAERFSVLDGSSDPEDPLDGPFPGHGVAVSSVLASRGGLTAAPPSGTALGTTPPPGEGPDGNHRVTGVAPACTVLPVRAIESVVAISNIDVAEGIWHCVTQEVDVISLSIGGYANPFLERVVSFAVFHDIIVVAAAGQIWPFVPAPALYPDCIAATGSTIDRTPWSDASTGVAIDIAAPAVNVWKADAVRDGEQVTMVVQNSTSGTSFAAPTVAGAAALWLAHHGRDALLERYRGGPKLAEVLRHLLAVTAAPGVSWDPRKNGPGILHVSDLLLAGLPAGGAVGGRDWSSYDESSEEDLLRAWLGNPDPDLLDRILQILFGADADDLRGAIDRFGGELLTAVAGVADAADNLRAAVEAAAEQAADAAGELAEEAAESIEEVVDEVADVVSDAFATAAGWFD
jgi:subtilisin family serine protease